MLPLFLRKIQFALCADSAVGYGIHSPFVFDFTQTLLLTVRKKKHPSALSKYTHLFLSLADYYTKKNFTFYRQNTLPLTLFPPAVNALPLAATTLLPYAFIIENAHPAYHRTVFFTGKEQLIIHLGVCIFRIHNPDIREKQKYFFAV